MYINRINGQTTFGYNKEVNTELRNKLKNDNQHQSEKIKDLIILQGYSINIEDELRNAEKTSEDTKKNNLLVLFSTIKKTLAEQVEKFYPELHFAQREAAEYIKEDMFKILKHNREIIEDAKDAIESADRANAPADRPPPLPPQNRSAGCRPTRQTGKYTM